jgi:hypothetical protein
MSQDPWPDAILSELATGLRRYSGLPISAYPRTSRAGESAPFFLSHSPLLILDLQANRYVSLFQVLVKMQPLASSQFFPRSSFWWVEGR